MAKKVIKTGYVELPAGTDRSSLIANCSINIEVEEGNSDNYAGNGWHEFLQGMLGYSLEIEFKKDADLSTLDSAIWTVLTNGTGTLTWLAKMENAAKSDANAEYTGTVLVTGWNTGPGPLGQVYGGSVTWRGTGAIVRDTTP